ncbi:MAG: hypothetical protein JWP16_1884 [Alphaproteobacteria bacterium]|jgi:hypothetical protein|nr:hypothetical protein [Alphaproteobacteria bacterium]MDB5740844.1 hypothetical protein [Alphaproteobacteria bacterium]
MAIDPVILLISELQENEKRLVAECKLQARSYCPGRAECTAALLDRIRALYNELRETAPTSAIGAGELIRIIVQRLPSSHARYGRNLEEVADRLRAGQRHHADLLWIRALSETIVEDAPDENSIRTAALLNLAIRGASQPVIVHRTFTSKPGIQPLEERRERHINSAPSILRPFAGRLKTPSRTETINRPDLPVAPTIS